MTRTERSILPREFSEGQREVTRDRALRLFDQGGFHHLISKAEFAKILENDAVVDQLWKVLIIAKDVLQPAILQYRQSVGDEERRRNFEKLTSVYLDYYLLVAPCPMPDEHPEVLAAEHRHNVPSISRNQDGTNSVWLSGKPSEGYRGQQRIPTDELTDTEAKDAWNWFGPEGLIVHTAGAAKLFEYLLTAAKMSIPVDEFDAAEKHPLNKHQQEILGTKVFDGAISLWGHDDGRTITHNPIGHMVFSQIISMSLGLPAYLRQDYDLATELLLHREKPIIEPSDEFAIADKFGAGALLWSISDNFSKFIDIIPAEERGKDSDPRSYLQIRLPGTESRFFAWRNLNYSDPSLTLFYERQVVLVQSVLDYISSPQGLNVPPERLRLAFLQTGKYMHQFMEDKKLSYWLSQF